MANKRMFSKLIVDSDAFLDMPLSSQCLYFHLNMRADDDGFINSPKRVMRIIGCSDDDLKILIAKRFLLSFENGVIVVKHWRVHNAIRKDRHTQTLHREELSKLTIKDNGSYTETTKMLDYGNQMATTCRHSIEENRIEEGSIEPPHKKKFLSFVFMTDEEYNSLCKRYGKKNTEDYIERVDLYLYDNPKKRDGKTAYKSHYRTILKWMKKDNVQEISEPVKKLVIKCGSCNSILMFKVEACPYCQSKEIKEVYHG